MRAFDPESGCAKRRWKERSAWLALLVYVFFALFAARIVDAEWGTHRTEAGFSLYFMPGLIMEGATAYYFGFLTLSLIVLGLLTHPLVNRRVPLMIRLLRPRKNRSTD
jgi:hypothetical protein